MNCYQFRLKISSYLDSELSFSELKAFREHVEACAPCAASVSQMEGIKVALGKGIQSSLSPEFVPHLQARLRAEINRTPSWWRQLTAPRVRGFSPITLSGLAAAALALLVIGVSLFHQESAPLVDPPQGTIHTNPPPMITPNPAGNSPSDTPLLIATPSDTVFDQRDSTRRDFSRKIKYVNQGQRP